ncbi:hypothetical protein BH23ACT12_BH23ACT12_22710 [soil metagenome]
MSRPQRSFHALLALGLVLSTGACSNQTSAERTLESLSTSPQRSATPVASPTPTGLASASPSPEEALPAAAPGGARTASSGSRTTGNRASGAASTSGARDENDVPEPGEAPQGGGRDFAPGHSASGGGLCAGWDAESAGDDGGSAAGRDNDSKSGDDGDEGDPGRDEDRDDDN